MKKLLLGILFSLLCTVLFAQDENNVFYHFSDSTANDTAPAFTRHSFGFYFMAANTFNSGTAIAPPVDQDQIGITGTTTKYTSMGPDVSGFGFGFGASYESKPFVKRLFYSIGISLTAIKYTGSAILTTTSPNPVYDATENVSYSWSAFIANIPVEFHAAFVQTKRVRLDISFGALANFYITQNNSGASSAANYDAFNIVGASGVASLGFEYHVAGSLLIRVEPCYVYSFSKSSMGRRLGVEGIQLGIVFK
jgi:hypothetical protein